MLPSYRDILDRIAEDPMWWDRHGVPRYEKFQPNMLGVYDSVAVFALIQCQDCGRAFQVGVGQHQWNMDLIMSDPPSEGDDVEYYRNTVEKLAGSFHYGDPPRHNCVGDTMNCVDLKILEAWDRDKFNWTRHPELEGMIDDGT